MTVIAVDHGDQITDAANTVTAKFAANFEQSSL